MTKTEKIKIEKKPTRTMHALGRFEETEIEAINKYCKKKKISRAYLFRSLVHTVIPSVSKY